MDRWELVRVSVQADCRTLARLVFLVRSGFPRFQREAEVLASLNHPNIATVHGVEDRALVMELVEGDHQKVHCRSTRRGRSRHRSLQRWNNRALDVER